MIRINSTDDLWWAIFDDAEHTVKGHLRNYKAEFIQIHEQDYIDFYDPKLYTVFILKYANYI